MSNGDTCQTCELMETCSFYWNYRDHPDVQDRHLIDRYCSSDMSSSTCKRIVYYREEQEFPPSNLSPEGDIISGQSYAQIPPAPAEPPLSA